MFGDIDKDSSEKKLKFKMNKMATPEVLVEAASNNSSDKKSVKKPVLLRQKPAPLKKTST